jgi:nitrous oxidase accessory protein NosD
VNTTINSTKINNFEQGISFYGDNNNALVSNSTITNSNYGILIDSPWWVGMNQNIRITNNLIAHNQIGILVQGMRNNVTMSSNTYYNNEEDIVIQ